MRLRLKLKPKLNLLLLLAGGLCAGEVQASTLAETEADCRIEGNELKCRTLNDVNLKNNTGYPAGRNARFKIPNNRNVWVEDNRLYYPAQDNPQVTVLDGTGQDISSECSLNVNLTHWVTERLDGHKNGWAEVNKISSNNYNRGSNWVWWSGVLKRSGDIAKCPPGILTVRLTFTPVVTHQTSGHVSGSFPPVQADFRVLNTKHVRLSVPPAVGLNLTANGAAGSGIIRLQRWGDVSMEVTRADDGGEPSLNSPSGSTTVPLSVTLDTLSGRRNVAKGSTDNVVRWDGRAGENGYRLNIATQGNVKKQLTDEPGTWRSTLSVTVNAL
ncbi:hypothetical protein R0K18_15260 [Pantoea sp. SIMBA_133]